jgi:hypothetical protein
MLSRTAGACSPRQAARLLPGPTDTPRTPWAAHRGRAYAGHDLVGAGTRQPLVRSGAGGCVGLCLAFLPPPHAHLRVWWVAPMIRLRGRCALIPKVRAVGRPFVSHAVVSAGDGCGGTRCITYKFCHTRRPAAAQGYLCRISYAASCHPPPRTGTPAPWPASPAFRISRAPALDRRRLIEGGPGRQRRRVYNLSIMLAWFWPASGTSTLAV